MKGIAQRACLALICIALAACARTNEDEDTAAEMASAGDEAAPMPTAEETARADNARIRREANVLLSTDHLGYREGETTPVRVQVQCRAGVCSAGFSAFVCPCAFTDEASDVEVQRGLNGIRKIIDRASHRIADFHVLGGWMEHSFFASQAELFTNDRDPDQGGRKASSYAMGMSTGENPTVLEGGATWRGFVAGRDVSVTDSLEAAIEGEARIFVDFGPVDGLEADVAFTRLFNRHTGELHPDLSWDDLVVSEGGFAHRDAVDDRITGRFFGPEQEEVAGTFERAGISGAFGARVDD